MHDTSHTHVSEGVVPRPVSFLAAVLSCMHASENSTGLGTRLITQYSHSVGNHGGPGGHLLGGIQHDTTQGGRTFDTSNLSTDAQNLLL